MTSLQVKLRVSRLESVHLRIIFEGTAGGGDCRTRRSWSLGFDRIPGFFAIGHYARDRFGRSCSVDLSCSEQRQGHGSKAGQKAGRCQLGDECRGEKTFFLHENRAYRKRRAESSMIRLAVLDPLHSGFSVGCRTAELSHEL